MKRIIVCCDGTWNAADTQTAETNVALMARAIHGSQGTGGILQIVLYLRGVGTSGLKLETLIEGAIGFGLENNIRSAYMFIAQNYIPGDEIYLFGFSRGAFTVRSLAGFVSACGVLKRQTLGALPDAWDYYRATGPHAPADFMEKFKTDCHLDAKIKFLGVWDTVGALGIPISLLAAANEKLFAFHNTGPCAAVQHGCHALAIDEHRDQFVPTLWTGQAPAGCRIEQVWFAGCHSDVGGGFVTRKLADIPLVWMAKKAEADGLAVDWGCLPDRLDPLEATHDSVVGLFAADRLRPTWREIAERPCEVSFYERLYAPTDGAGHNLPTINQKLHGSIVERYGKAASTCSSDKDGDCALQHYEPKNLAPFFSAGTILPGAPVES
jgi:uncharacterized protein (DUF2235 family)